MVGELFSKVTELKKMIAVEENKAINKRNVHTKPTLFTSTDDIISVRSALSVDNTKSSTHKQQKKSISANVINEAKDERPVSKLRPGKPLISKSSESVLDVAQMLAKKRGYAALITNNSGTLEGIITDKDITRRVVARYMDPSSTIIANVMTENPTCVAMNDSAMESLMMMIENRHRHLPVLDEYGNVAGLLDISKFLNDAISKLENHENKSNNSLEDAVKQVSSLHGANQDQVEALQALLGPLLNQSSSDQTLPTLRSLSTGRPSTIVRLGMFESQARSLVDVF